MPIAPSSEPGAVFAAIAVRTIVRRRRPDPERPNSRVVGSRTGAVVALVGFVGLAVLRGPSHVWPVVLGLFLSFVILGVVLLNLRSTRLTVSADEVSVHTLRGTRRFPRASIVRSWLVLTEQRYNNGQGLQDRSLLLLDAEDRTVWAARESVWGQDVLGALVGALDVPTSTMDERWNVRRVDQAHPGYLSFGAKHPVALGALLAVVIIVVVVVGVLVLHPNG